MSRDLVVEAHRDEVIDFGPVTRRSLVTGLPVAINLGAAGAKLWFTVKATRTDAYAAALIAKTYVAGGASDGILVTTASSLTDVNGSVTIPRADLDYETRQSFYWDLMLEEPGGRRSTIERGAFKVVMPVSDPA